MVLTTTPAKNQTTEFLKRQEAANHLNLKISTLEAWAVRGGGPPMVKFGRAVRYRLSDLEAWANSQTRTSTSQA